MLYHLISRTELDRQPGGEPVIEPSLAGEGFIHLSATIEQVTWVANRFYRDVPDLVALVVDERLLSAAVHYDPTPDGVFPHLYGPLDREAIIEVEPLRRGDQGDWSLIEP